MTTLQRVQDDVLGAVDLDKLTDRQKLIYVMRATASSATGKPHARCFVSRMMRVLTTCLHMCQELG